GFEVRGEERGIVVVDDYGHHPEEIRATLRAAREGFARRLLVAFQPHRFSRTRDLFDDFLGAFDDADLLLLTEIYPAGETPLPGVSGDALYQALKRRGHLDVHWVAGRERLADTLLAVMRPGDLVLVLGAGDISRTADELLAMLRSGVATPQIHCHVRRRPSPAPRPRPRRPGAGGRAARTPHLLSHRRAGRSAGASGHGRGAGERAARGERCRRARHAPRR